MVFSFFSHLPLMMQWLTSFLLGFVLILLLGKKFIHFLYALRIGQPVRYEDCPTLYKLHEKKKDTPTMGGILLIGVMSGVLILFGNGHSASFWLILLTLIGLGALGAIDDYKKLKLQNAKGISSKKKFLGQISIGGLIAFLLYLNQEGLFFEPIILNQNGHQSLFDSMIVPFPSFSSVPYFLLVPIMLCFFLFVFCGSSNAVNLTDGLDGLAAGSLTIVGSGLLVLMLQSSILPMSEKINFIVAIACMIGVNIGFLWFNHFPAQIFMGDTGSLSLGGLVALSAVFIKKEWIFALMGIVFVGEALSVILQVLSYRYRNKKRIFLCSPIHHHFQYLGWHEVKIVTRFWIVSIIATLIAIGINSCY
jgi:phospho-N-acetylmuramoyl-pentapeptide-transferase